MQKFSLAGLIVITLCCSSWLAADPAAPTPSPVTSFSDTLLPNEARPVNSPLRDSKTAEGAAKWVALKATVIGANGATATEPSGGHIPIPPIAGKIRIEADVTATGTAFTGLAFGRGDLTEDFWRNLALMLTIAPGGRYNIFTAGKEIISAPDKTLFTPNSSNHVDLTLDTMARTATMAVNGKIALTDLPIPKEADLGGITAVGFRFQEPVTANAPSVSNFKVTLQTLAATGLVPVDYAMTFVVPGQEATLSWKVTSPGPTKDVPYVINDYRGNKVASGNAQQGDDGIITLKRTFDRGYAEIEFPAAAQTFGVVSIEPLAGAVDPFYGMDASLTWLELDPARREGLIKIMGRSGIAVARERWDGVFTSKPGTYEWDRPPRVGGTVRQLYTDNHVKVLDILEGGSSRFGPVAGQPFPQDLSPMASEWGGVVDHWESLWCGAEIYNESDLKSVPADQYAPLVKTLSYSFSQAKSTVPIVGGTFATVPPGAYFTACTANGLLSDSDAISFHMYDPATAIEKMVSNYRAWMKAGNAEGLPLWLTEFGKAWTSGPARPAPEQDASSGQEMAAIAIEARACGVAHAFPFVLVYYIEGSKNFSMMGREATPLRIMADYVQSVSALSGKDYLGDMKGLGTTVKRSRVFGDKSAGEWVTVLYTGEVNPDAIVPFPVKFTRLTGADGRALTPVNGQVPIPDGLTYVWGNASDFTPSLDKETPAARLYKIGKNPLVRNRLASPIVLQLLPQDLPAKTSARRYLVSPEIAHALPLTVRIHNLSGTALNVTPALTLPGGSPQPKDLVSVPAMGHVDVSWTVDASHALDIAETRLVTITAKSSGDIQPSPLALPVTMEGTMEQHLARFKTKTPLGVSNLADWSGNSSMPVKFSVVPDNIWRMDAVSGGGWAYPKFNLPSQINSTIYSGLLIRARLLTPGTPAIIADCGAAGQHMPSFWVPGLFPGDGEFHAVYIPFDEFVPGPGGVGNQNTRLDPSTWTKLEIGSDVRGAGYAFEISDLILVGGAGGN